VIKDLNFRHIGSDIPVLESLNLTILAHEITAIVGISGSGKTTLMKLLLKVYEQNSGEIISSPPEASRLSKGERDSIMTDSPLGGVGLKNVAQNAWRSQVGGVILLLIISLLVWLI
jgi:ATP-binding cassette subfamily B protein